MKFFLLFFFFISSLSYGFEIPKLTSPVVDQAGILSSQVRDALSQSLYSLKNKMGSEIAVVTLKSLDGETIEGASLKIAEKWKLGSKEKDNGILFLIALEEKRMRIEVGQGHEGDLPDVMAGRIIDSVKTYFRRGDYQSGVIVGVDLIVKNIGGNLKDLPRVSRKNTRHRKGMIIYLIFVIIIVFFGRGGRRGLISGLILGGSSMGGRSSHGSGSFGGRGGFSGGGSFGGGGGGFSGGGASGGW